LRILSARISDFRNVAQAALTFAPRLTAFVGENGQGKTNLLEALYLVAALRPLRSVGRIDLVRSGERRAAVEVAVHSARTTLTTRLTLELGPEGRRLKRDDKACEANTFVGHLVAVAFTPDDLDLTKGAPEARRRFLDRALFNARPAYLSMALRYAKALKARNRVLLDEGDDGLLEAFDATLARAGAEVLAARLAYAELLGPRVLAAFAAIASPAPTLSMRYVSSLADVDATSSLEVLTTRFHDALVRRRANDRRRKKTTVGPHLDDLDLVLGDRAARVRASQGQHRALALALKLGEIGLVTDALGEPPVLLLDDVSSELDAPRTTQLFRALGPLEGQVVMTTTDGRQVDRWADALGLAPRVHHVAAGTFTAVDGA
jgi:DNA replication and repair protein RecF